MGCTTLCDPYPCLSKVPGLQGTALEEHLSGAMSLLMSLTAACGTTGLSLSAWQMQGPTQTASCHYPPILKIAFSLLCIKELHLI